VVIKRVERNKRKYVTAVSGLEAFGLENKKVAKDLGKKFATGSSVTKVASGGEFCFILGEWEGERERLMGCLSGIVQFHLRYLGRCGIWRRVGED